MGKERGPRHEECVFYNRLGIEPDPNPCGGQITQHHVLYQREGGKHGPRVCMCEEHQRFVHATDTWGGENFDNVIPRQPKGFAFPREMYPNVDYSLAPRQPHESGNYPEAAD